MPPSTTILLVLAHADPPTVSEVLSLKTKATLCANGPALTPRDSSNMELTTLLPSPINSLDPTLESSAVRELLSASMARKDLTSDWLFGTVVKLAMVMAVLISPPPFSPSFSDKTDVQLEELGEKLLTRSLMNKSFLSEDKGALLIKK